MLYAAVGVRDRAPEQRRSRLSAERELGIDHGTCRAARPRLSQVRRRRAPARASTQYYFRGGAGG